MPVIAYIVIFTLIGSIFSLVGGFLLLLNRTYALKISHLLSSFAAGALLGSAFFDLIPEAVEHAEEFNLNPNSVYIWVLTGIIIFFLLERFIHWFHHSHVHEEHEEKHTVPLIVLGDSIHNFIDGVAIALTFMASIPLGIITTIAVAAHEIPQEIGDFGILLKRGMSRKKIIAINIFSALLALLGAAVGYFIGEKIESVIPIALSLTAGFFLYISVSDLIPEIHHENRRGFAFYESVMLILGIVLLYFLISFAHNTIH